MATQANTVPRELLDEIQSIAMETGDNELLTERSTTMRIVLAAIAEIPLKKRIMERAIQEGLGGEELMAKIFDVYSQITIDITDPKKGEVGKYMDDFFEILPARLQELGVENMPQLLAEAVILQDEAEQRMREREASVVRLAEEDADIMRDIFESLQSEDTEFWGYITESFPEHAVAAQRELELRRLGRQESSSEPKRQMRRPKMR